MTYYYRLILCIIVVVIVYVNQKIIGHQHLLPVTINPINSKYIDLYANGDKQLLFRRLSLELQYMGDSYGRSSYIGKYDYELISKWLYLLDILNNKSNFSPSIAAYYFGSTNNLANIKVIIQYLIDHYNNSKDESKWWWLYQASYLSYHKEKNYDKAVKIANILSNVSDNIEMPIWARQLPALYLSKIGEHEHALLIIENILFKYKDKISDGQKNFMNHFIDKNLSEIKR